MTLINNSYPIFEADQVLSQKHLNKLISYLEEQDRASRVQLLGKGLVCGMEISKPTANSILVDCGVGITSLGHLIPFEAKNFTHFKTINLSESFLNPIINEDLNYLNDLYQNSNMYSSLETSMELLTSDINVDGKQPLTSDLLEDKIIMLLVETILFDVKNCIADDCDDKGKRIDFKVRPLLVDADVLSESGFKLNPCDNIYFNPLALPRYNVPKKPLKIASDIFSSYRTLIEKSISLVNTSFNTLHDHYEDTFGDLDNYIRLKEVSVKLNSAYGQNKDSNYLQYVWDWISDLVDTYNEIAEFHLCNPSLCCPEKSEFPFHILLGSAEIPTENIMHDNSLFKFRTPFVKTGITAADDRASIKVLKIYIEKLIRQIGNFNLNVEAVSKEGIKITPSSLRNNENSRKAIPFYYANIPELNKSWLPGLSVKNLNKNILSYHSKQYNTTSLAVSNPLEYDIKEYDFFRIEGHVGKAYADALTQVTALQEQYRLPFKVVGVNAVDDTGRTIIFKNDRNRWDDLEIEYDLAKTKLTNTLDFILGWLKNNKSNVKKAYPLFNDIFLNSLENTINEFKTLLTEDLTEFLENYQTFYNALEELNDLFLLHNACIDFVQRNNESAILQEIENRLEDFNAIILEDAFTIIYKEAIDRWIRGVKSTFLSEFSKKHTALEHEAGVVTGGTFVMVYSDYSIFQSQSSSVFISPLYFNFINEHKKKFNYSKPEIDKITSKNVLRKRKANNPYLLKSYKIKEEDECSNSVNTAILDYRDDISNFVFNTFEPSIAGYFDNNIANGFNKDPQAKPVTDNVQQKIIIADFYLPYLCNSDGDNINIVIENTQNEPNPIVADFDSNDFDDNDFFTDKP
jgi:hypothetical protein